MTVSQSVSARAQAVLDGKAKPPGSLGLLELWAKKLAVLQKTSQGSIVQFDETPFKIDLASAVLLVFAADHGVVSGKPLGESVSAFPQSVSISIFEALGLRGNAAGAVLAQANGLDAMYVVDVGLKLDHSQSTQCSDAEMSVKGMSVVCQRSARVCNGTRDFVVEPAMTSSEREKAMRVGRKSVAQAVERFNARIICCGEVGIGNTTSSSAIVAAITRALPSAVCGKGTGLGSEGVKRKVATVERSLALHNLDDEETTIDAAYAHKVLECVGGLEIAALVGTMLECYDRNVGIMVDGLITCAAALVAYTIQPDIMNCMFFSHTSDEAGGVAAIFTHMGAENIPLNMILRLGEGTGAVCAVPILRAAVAMFNDMVSLNDALQPVKPEEQLLHEVEVEVESEEQISQSIGNSVELELEDLSQTIEDPTRIISKDEVSARGTGAKDGEEFTLGFWSEIRVMFTALMFLTRLPCPASTDHHPEFLLRSMPYYPLVGAFVGFFGANIYLFINQLSGSTIVGAVLAVTGTVWLTGCFHEDGLADTLDGFGGGWGKIQILRIMQDSRVGTYGLVGTSLWLSVRLTLYSSLPSTIDLWASMIAAHCVARLTALPMVYLFPYLVDSGDPKGALYNRFAEVTTLLTRERVAVGYLISFSIVCLLKGMSAAIQSVLIVTILGLCAGYYGVSVIGGVIGDFLGATICIAETVLLMWYVILSRGQDNGLFKMGLWDVMPIAGTIVGLSVYINAVNTANKKLS
ncbi:hypothetical protein SARC_07750 [Sphaeroforma arctica JP610]|uniref:Nicotinate-nucleotide--dimethylbenzimidazole phosphoribosyltransferase n=1 Tax=Sphaeroforma arctica JP610 TaxID=667725 RepID=A0A0L0FSV5_9EUKA|nr:hypothetical protein SARC_07750 [Sphaeroforma arctica JP610]KNC79865.1 hypothetical protein SARC_07750 [Sphaeroforma arctica JP610]|eukprot:XP_014153767.1 hypothetical protein SARC_07750 [Sphaeroforma arctica JP610]